MYLDKKILAVITAREGSKRLPNKNILDLAGKPLIAWTIDEAKKSKYIDKLIVSTDSDEIAKISLKHGAEVPFMRPLNLASDNADSFSVLKHAIEFYKNKFDYILLLQPTSPLRLVNDIDSSIEMIDNTTRSIVSVCQTEHSPLWSNTLPDNLSMKSFLREEVKNKRSQDLPIYYRLNGAVYIAEIDYFLKEKSFIGTSTKAFIMAKNRSLDIDEAIDFKLAALILKEFQV
jgi:CMP-N-acetylneuraminic acid synthetase